MSKINITFSYNSEGKDGEKITKWLLAAEKQGNISEAIRRLILNKPLQPKGIEELSDEVAQLREELDELRKKIEDNI